VTNDELVVRLYADLISAQAENAALKALLREAQDEDVDEFSMGRDWHTRTRAALKEQP